MTCDPVGSLGHCFTPRQKPESRMNVVASRRHLAGVFRPFPAIGPQHEVNDIGDPGDLGLLRIGLAFGEVALGKVIRSHLFQAFPGLTCGPDLVLELGDDPGRHRGGAMLVRVSGWHLDDGTADDLAHVGRHYHPHKPAAALLNEIGVSRPDH